MTSTSIFCLFHFLLRQGLFYFTLLASYLMIALGYEFINRIIIIEGNKGKSTLFGSCFIKWDLYFSDFTVRTKVFSQVIFCDFTFNATNENFFNLNMSPRF